MDRGIKKYRFTLMRGISSATGKTYLEESKVFAELSGYKLHYTKGNSLGEYNVFIECSDEEACLDFCAETIFGSYFHVTRIEEPKLLKRLWKKAEDRALDKLGEIFSRPVFWL